MYSAVVDEVVYDISHIQLIGGGAEFSSVLTDFLPAGSVQKSCPKRLQI